MARLCRAELIDPDQITLVHVVNRTVRRCFLFGDDPVSGKNFDHRKVWIEERLERFAGCFGIDLLCFAILSNHYHLILRSRPDVVATWDDTEVARRWLMICPPTRKKGQSAAPTEAELDSIRRCPVRLAEVRRRLRSISWWMRLLNQNIAQRANREDEQSGRFWQDRYRATRLDDEESLLACAAYVDLNPIRAGLAETVEASDHTSVQRRLESRFDVRPTSVAGCRGPRASSATRRDAFLAKLTIEKSDAVGAVPAENGRRCSDKGFLSLSDDAYLELLDWTARQIAPGKRGSTPMRLPSILKRLGLEQSSWCELVADFDRCFYLVAGRCDRVQSVRSHHTGRRFRVRPLARRLLPAAA
ncbi:hypothetical protein FYK55_21565 [Roseiconus nitratireducens]|uniref:Transposase IS200-like domain-containing protein n=1 Tax=Roseiconus nitratireducens TaxID=2605748 RepID=A0A5M6CZD2_9BACT|nr:transposase [Roseiconus nitratireducens]KAA5540226.1 hypothetical protein FYK55_21565 [Roseiconus nitratireducens]